jgi:hypothetical protein
LATLKRHHTDWLQAFIEYAQNGEAPVSMYFWTGVATVAGALKRNVWIDQKYFQWIPNFYIVIVAPPGIVSKSTTASIGMNLLRSVPGVKFGPDICTWQALSQAFANSLELIQMPDGMMHAMSALTIESSEFGNLLNPSDREMVDFLITLWDGKRGAVRKITKTQENDVIENPFINIIACTTPSWLEGAFQESMVGGGFTSRCVWLFADAKRQYVAYPARHTPPDFQQRQDRLIEDLIRISELRGEFEILPDAIEWGEAWYEEHYKNKPPTLDNNRFGGYIARKQTHIHKLAMVLSAAQGRTLTISRAQLEMACEITTALERDMPKVFERIGTSFQARGASNLVALVRAHKTISRKALFHAMFKELSLNDFNAALNAAYEAGHVDLVQIDGAFHVRAI